MLRTTRWVAAIIFLYSFPGYAEETFDTHFMIGGMRGEKVSEYRFDNKQPLPGNYELDVYVNHQWRGKQDITIPESPAKPCLPKVLLTTLGVKTIISIQKIIVFYWMKRFMVDNISGISVNTD